METWDVIRARRNVREYEDRPIPTEDLDLILEAGRRTPSSMNQQAWEFVVVTDRERLRALAGVWRYAGHIARSAATVVIVIPASEDPDTRETYQYDAGQATMSIMLAAADLGIGSGHASVGDQELARDLLGLPNDRGSALEADRTTEPASVRRRRAPRSLVADPSSRSWNAPTAGKHIQVNVGG
jgi:nitroreductase